MTREEAKTTFIVHSNGQDEWLRIDKRTYQNFIDKIYDAHEAELKAKDERIQTQKDAISFLENTVKEKIACIAELEAKIEPKSCDGCKYEEDKRGGNCYAFSSCSRDSFDHYNPKERG